MNGLFDNPTLMLLVTEPQRERALAYLQGAYADGRLDEIEFEDRVSQVLAARTRGELNSAFKGLVHVRTSSDAVGRVGSGAVARNIASGLVHWSGLVSWFVGPAIIVGASEKGSVVRVEAVKALTFTLAVSVVMVLGLLLPFDWAAFLWVLGWLAFWFVSTAAMGFRGLLGSTTRYPLVGGLGRRRASRRELR